MHDARVKALKKNLSALLDSLDASLRVAAWDASHEAVPEPLVRLASTLPSSFGAVRELAGASFKSSGAEVAKLDRMRAATARLSTSYENYEASRGSPEDHGGAVQALEEDIRTIREEAEGW